MSSAEKALPSSNPFTFRTRHTSMPNLNPGPSHPTTLTPQVKPYAGRLGGAQDFVLDRSDPANAATLSRVPDAAPLMSVAETLSLRGFAQREIWQAACIECLGTMLLVYITAWIGSHPIGPSPPLPIGAGVGVGVGAAGVYGTPAFLGPLVGGITSWIIVTVFIYSMSSVSGAHLNPLISIATFCARLTSLPRMVLYVAHQTLGATLAGLMLRASYGSRDFDVGGCSIDTRVVSVGEAFSIEFMSNVTLLFLAFGVGLDPRQRQIFGPALAPALVGLSLGVLTFGTAITRPGYGGASMNPTRCLGVFVATRFPGWHWIHWVGPIAAAFVHSVFYVLVPPWDFQSE